jgi:large subunit ribosomal protein L6
MSRVAKKAIELPKGVEINVNGQAVKIKGPKGSFDYELHETCTVDVNDNVLTVVADNPEQTGYAMAGTMRALLNNMVVGVSDGYEKKLELVGVGYRAQAQGNKLNLTLGFSHPVVYDVPEGISIETPSQTEILVKGSDKQKVGQVAADIRAYRPPEPYKGKGVKYADERIIRKEAKKK